MHVFQRLTARFRKKPKKETERTSERATEVVVSSKVTPTESERGPPTVVRVSREFRPPTPVGSIVAVAGTEEISLDSQSTTSRARIAQIGPQRITEIVPGQALKRDEKGRIHIKIVFYGPSLSGKTTALRWLFANVRAFSKGKIVEVSDELGRTTFFDFIPVSASDRIVFDVFTVPGQRRHAQNRIFVLRDADGIIFMADSRPESMNENLASIQELRIAMGTDRMATVPIVISLNKRDLPNALPVNYMTELLDVEGFPMFPTVATEGKNLVRMFQRVLRDALVFKVGI